MSSSSTKLWAVVPAAGSGKRIGGETPKQYLDLNGKKIIEHTLERLASHPQVAGIVVAISDRDDLWQTVNLPDQARIIDVQGGFERHHSVLNALNRLTEFIKTDDWVLVHDAARPCVRVEDIDKMISHLIHHPTGGILGVPVADTMKRVDEYQQIVNTVDRAGLWHAQTPQMFRLGELSHAIQHTIDTGIPITDEASAMELQGVMPLLIEGHKDNIKITEQQDLLLAAMILEQQTRQAAS